MSMKVLMGLYDYPEKYWIKYDRDANPDGEIGAYSREGLPCWYSAGARRGYLQWRSMARVLCGKYLNIDKAFDLDGRVYRPLLKLMPEGPKNFKRISPLSSSPKHDIFLGGEDRASVIASDDLAQLLDTTQLKGVALSEKLGSM